MRKDVIELAVVILAIVGTLLYVELHDRNSKLRSWLWCRKWGFNLREYASPIGGGMFFWCGVDEAGGEYIPDKDGYPIRVN